MSIEVTVCIYTPWTSDEAAKGCRYPVEKFTGSRTSCRLAAIQQIKALAETAGIDSSNIVEDQDDNLLELIVLNADKKDSGFSATVVAFS